MVDCIILILGGWLIAALIMLALWLVYLFTKSPSIVDIGWGGSIGSAACWMYFYVPEISLRQHTIFFCVIFWSLRIVALLISRISKGQKDQRYVELSERWKTNLSWKYFLFFQAQAISVALLITPIALSYLALESFWTYWDTIGLLLFFIGFFGEVIADYQMAKFRQDLSNQKRVCDIGLWYYSRHPNYFFEWVIWLSYSLVAMNHLYGVVGWISPAILLFSILKVTGIPPTEKRLLKSKGDMYNQYQKTTSAFIPMLKKRF